MGSHTTTTTTTASTSPAMKQAAQQEAQGEEVTPRCSRRLVARRVVWLAVLSGSLLLALVVGLVTVHVTRSDITSTTARTPSEITPSAVNHSSENSDTNLRSTEHPSKESDTSLHVTERLDTAKTNHRVTTRSLDNQCKSDDDTNIIREWDEQNTASKSICAPKPHYIYDKKFGGHGVIVNRCPGGCGTCPHASHTCRSIGTKEVEKLAQFTANGERCYKKVLVKEDTECICDVGANFCPHDEDMKIIPW